MRPHDIEHAAAGTRYEVLAAVGGPEHCISVVEQKMKK
jgi:hypothetical protein